MALSLDGNTSFIGTEFIKLLNTGSSDLATVEYVNEQVALGGGSGDGYTQAEVDALLNNKLNVNNPQDIIGTLRIDSTNGNGKLVVNALDAPNDEDFYVNGLSTLGGTLKCSLLQASSNIETSQLLRSDKLNTYTNTDMKIQRNSIDYIVLESDKINFKKDIYVNDVLLTSSDGNFNEDVIIADTFKLKTDTVSSNGLNDLVFEVDTLGEFFRCQVSDNTVRVPNTRSFLSQNLFSDIIKPITYSNNISFQAQNNTNNGYEEYIKINSTTKKVDFNKPISSITCNEFKSEGDTQVDFKRHTDTFMQFKTDGRIHIPRQCFFASIVGLDNTGSLSMVKRPESSIQIFEFSNTFGTNGKYRFKLASNNILEMSSTLIQATRNLQCDAGIKTNTINTATDTDLSFQRNGTEFFKLTSIANTIEVADTSRILTPSIYTDIIACNNLGTDTVFYGSNTIENQAVEYFRFNHNNERVDFSKSVRLGNALIIDIAEKLTMRPSLETGVNIFDIRNLHPIVDNPMIRFRVGTGAGDSIVCEMRNEYVSMARNVIMGTAYELRTNKINSNSDNDVVFFRNDIQYLTLDNFTEDTVEREAIICSKQLRANANILVKNLQINQFAVGIEYSDFRLENADSIMRFYVGNSTSVNFQITNTGLTLGRVASCTAGLKSNIIDTYTDTDLKIRRNGTEVLNIFTYTPTNGPSIIVDAQTDCGISSNWLFANVFANRSANSDTEFRGCIPNGLISGKVFMTYKHITEILDVDCHIDATGYDITGNLINTGVSDKRLKTNIKDIDDANYSDCVKNVKLKTFEFKDKQFDNQDKYGMIAQDLQEHLPKEFKSIVRQNIPKKGGDKEYLSINYMKLSVVLWGALQETLTKVEHLESSVYELQEEFKDKKKPKPKPKAKSKSKPKNVD